MMKLWEANGEIQIAPSLETRNWFHTWWNSSKMSQQFSCDRIPLTEELAVELLVKDGRCLETSHGPSLEVHINSAFLSLHLRQLSPQLTHECPHRSRAPSPTPTTAIDLVASSLHGSGYTQWPRKSGQAAGRPGSRSSPRRGQRDEVPDQEYTTTTWIGAPGARHSSQVLHHV